MSPRIPCGEGYGYKAERVSQLDAPLQDFTRGNVTKGQISAALATVSGQQELRDAVFFCSKILLCSHQPPVSRKAIAATC